MRACTSDARCLHDASLLPFLLMFSTTHMLDWSYRRFYGINEVNGAASGSYGATRPSAGWRSAGRALSCEKRRVEEHVRLCARATQLARGGTDAEHLCAPGTIVPVLDRVSSRFAISRRVV